MKDRIAAALASVDAQLTAEQWADAFWLARYLPAPQAREPSVPPSPTEDPSPVEDTARPEPPQQQPDRLMPEGLPMAVDEGATLHLPASASE